MASLSRHNVRRGLTAAVASATLAFVALGIVVRAWSEAKAEENDSFMCSFGMFRTDVGVLVRDDRVGPVCVYLDADGRTGRVAPMTCVEGKLDFETRGGALLDVRKTSAGFRCVYRDRAGDVLRVRHVEER